MKRMHAVAGIALLCLAALCFGAGIRSAWSEEKVYPTRQINYMVCFDPGGQSDREARRQQLHFPIAPLVLASVLAQMLETSLQQSLLISQGSWLIFFNRPIAGFFMALALASIARGIWLQVRSHAPEIAIDDADE